jgi:hypothetical protein
VSRETGQKHAKQQRQLFHRGVGRLDKFHILRGGSVSLFHALAVNRTQPCSTPGASFNRHVNIHLNYQLRP